MESHHEFHVFAQRILREAAARANEVAAEDAERAGDDQEAVQPQPGRSANEEGAQIFRGLAFLGAGAGDGRPDDRVVFDQRAELFFGCITCQLEAEG